MELSQQWDQLRNPKKSETRKLAHYKNELGHRCWKCHENKRSYRMTHNTSLQREKNSSTTTWQPRAVTAEENSVELLQDSVKYVGRKNQTRTYSESSDTV